MTSFARSKDARLDFRIKPGHKSQIERAAFTSLSARDSQLFLRMLDSEAAPNAALKAAAARYRRGSG